MSNDTKKLLCDCTSYCGDDPGFRKGVALQCANARKFIASHTAPDQGNSELRRNLVPGVMRCAKCDFQLTRTNLHMYSGTTSAGDSKTELCPNNCGPLWPVTWEQYATQGWEVAERYFGELESLRKPATTVPQVAQSVPSGWKLVPIEPTEEMIQAACMQQSLEKFDSYDAWWNSHSGGISERIRNYLAGDYKAMIASAPQVAAIAPVPSDEQNFDLLAVILWLEGGCDPKHAASELRIYRDKMLTASNAGEAAQGEKS